MLTALLPHVLADSMWLFSSFGTDVDFCFTSPNPCSSSLFTLTRLGELKGAGERKERVLGLQWLFLEAAAGRGDKYNFCGDCGEGRGKFFLGYASLALLPVFHIEGSGEAIPTVPSCMKQVSSLATKSC